MIGYLLLYVAVVIDRYIKARARTALLRKVQLVPVVVAAPVVGATKETASRRLGRRIERCAHGLPLRIITC